MLAGQLLRHVMSGGSACRLLHGCVLAVAGHSIWVEASGRAAAECQVCAMPVLRAHNVMSQTSFSRAACLEFLAANMCSTAG